MAETRLETARLILRDWRVEDVDDFPRLGSDPQVMATLGPPMSREETAAPIADLQSRAARFGHTFWAVERKEDGRVIGFTGLSRGKILQIEGELEIGWRLAADCWRQGYAQEAAEAELAWASEHRPRETVIAITSRTNERSRLLMERLRMVYRPERDFDYPGGDPDDPLTPTVLYATNPSSMTNG
jgi:RimJ/RimL family protein N-acetyltransferase